jgi:molybdopterin molybdotransferase
MLSNIPVEEALRLVLGAVRPVGVENVSLCESLGRVLAESVRASEANPPYDNSAMDGYGLAGSRLAALPARLKIVGTVFAGSAFRAALGPGEVVKIMTGAPIPRGVDRVIPFEEASEQDGCVVITRLPPSGIHIRRKGEDFPKGAVLIPKGRTIRPAETAILAAVGRLRVRVFRRPRVAILATGNELVPVGTPRKRGTIHDSNSPALAAAVLASGGRPVLLGIGRDAVADLQKKMARGLASDVLIVAGGVSAGEADYCLEALRSLGGRLIFYKVRQRPGHPLAFGRARRKPVFVLPGNPVSALMAFYLYVRPALRIMGGAAEGDNRPVAAELGEAVKGKAGRTEFYRVRLEDWDGRTLAFLTGPQGSGILTSLADAHGYIAVPERLEGLPKGARVEVYPL